MFETVLAITMGIYFLLGVALAAICFRLSGFSSARLGNKETPSYWERKRLLLRFAFVIVFGPLAVTLSYAARKLEAANSQNPTPQPNSVSKSTAFKQAV